MATNTTQYNFQKPEVGGDSDNWGDYLNGNWDITDSLLRGATQLSNIGIGATNTTIPLVCNAASAADITATFSGLVGIGTTSPESGLHIKNNTGVKVSDSDSTRHLILTPALSDGTPAIVESTSAYGLRLNASGTNALLQLYSNNTERMRIDSNGNVGIGTDSPQGNLHISAGTDGDATLILEADTDQLGSEADNPRLELRQDGNEVQGSIYLEGDPDQTASGSIVNALVIDSKNFHGNNDIQFATGGALDPDNLADSTVKATITDRGHFIIDGPNYSFQSDNYHLRLREDDGSCYLSNVQGGLYIGSSGYYYGSGQFKLTDGATSMSTILCAQNGNITFSNKTGGSANGVVTANERARIDSSGSFMVGTTSDGAFNGGFSVKKGTVDYINVGHSSSVGHGNYYVAFRHGNNTIGTITQSQTSGINYNTSSDERLKENIADSADAGSRVDAIQIRQFDWKADGTHQDYGVIAQELVTVAPEAVHQPEDSEEMMGVDYSKLVPMLIKEVQALRARVAELEENA